MEFWILLFILVSLFVALFIYIDKKITQAFNRQKLSEELLEYLKTTNTRIDEQNKIFTQTLQESSRMLNERLDRAAKIIQGVEKGIGEISEIGREMKKVHEFLLNPKLRGNVGEHILKEILEQMLPKEQFFLQYTFRSGEKVDAAIKTSAGIIPIDSKFPFQNFRKLLQAKDENERKLIRKDFEKDVKNHISLISKKYILTEEGTIDYALMYVPSESVYYEIVNNPRLFEFAAEKRVLPVSPATFYAYLKAVLMSLEGYRIQSKAREILLSIKAIQKDYQRLGVALSTLQKHLTHSYNIMVSVSGIFTQLGQKISSTRGLGEGKS